MSATLILLKAAEQERLQENKRREAEGLPSLEEEEAQSYIRYKKRKAKNKEEKLQKRRDNPPSRIPSFVFGVLFGLGVAYLTTLI